MKNRPNTYGSRSKKEPPHNYSLNTYSLMLQTMGRQIVEIADALDRIEGERGEEESDLATELQTALDHIDTVIEALNLEGVEV